MRRGFWSTFFGVLGFTCYMLLGVSFMAGTSLGAAMLGYYFIHPIAGYILGVIVFMISFAFIITFEEWMNI